MSLWCELNPVHPLSWWLWLWGRCAEMSGMVSLWPLGAQGCGVKGGWRGLCVTCLWSSSCCLWNQLKHNHQRVLVVLPFRSNLFAFGKAQKAPKGTQFQSIPRERYNNSFVFSSLLESESPSHKNKQTDLLTSCLHSAFGKAWSICQMVVTLL